MPYYINLPTDIPNAKERYMTRKANLKITNMFHFPIKWEFDYEMIGMVYIYHSSILIWLN